MGFFLKKELPSSEHLLAKHLNLACGRRQDHSDPRGGNIEMRSNENWPCGASAEFNFETVS